MDGVFVTGVDTSVGKTAFCSGLLKLLYGTRKACYWKPVQAGTIVSNDTEDAKSQTGLADEFFMDPLYRFAEPVVPYLAAKKWGKKIELEAFSKPFNAKRDAGYFVVVEGAGGLLVPFGENFLQLDLIKRLKLPVIFVAEDRVGSINQILLSLRVARDEGLSILGVVLTRSRRTFGNAECITHFGKVEILAEFDPAEDVKTLVAQIGGHSRLRDLFHVPSLPR